MRRSVGFKREGRMKNIWIFVVAGIIAAMPGCATAPMVLNETVGPNPSIAPIGESAGKLQVYSATEEEHEVGFQTAYFQRSPYTIYDLNGREIKNVNDNNKSEFLPLPRTVELPPGTYRVKALAAVGFGEPVVVPVVVEAGRTTEVHLNGHWRPPSNVASQDLVLAPAGFPIGWHATAQNQ
jgi:hypothetical protein